MTLSSKLTSIRSEINHPGNSAIQTNPQPRLQAKASELISFRKMSSDRRSKTKSNLFRRIMGSKREEAHELLVGHPPAPPQTTESGTSTIYMQGSMGPWGYMPSQMAAPPFPGVFAGAEPLQMAEQMRQMQTQIQQMQQMMHHFMASGTSMVTAPAKMGYAVELAPPQHFHPSDAILQTTITGHDRNSQDTVRKPTLSPPGSKRIICSVCTTAKAFVPWGHSGTSEFLQQNLTTKCQHEPSVCLPCLASWIEVQLDSEGWEAICCPQCPNLLEHNVI